MASCDNIALFILYSGEVLGFFRGKGEMVVSVRNYTMKIRPLCICSVN